jgi:hypothetical protein
VEVLRGQWSSKVCEKSYLEGEVACLLDYRAKDKQKTCFEANLCVLEIVVQAGCRARGILSVVWSE